MSTYILSILAFVTALMICAYSIPAIIKIAFIKKLYDKPGGRKTHKGYVPNLGGIAIFAAFLVSFLAWTDFARSSHLQYFILGLIILHFIGMKDDIVPLTPFKKLMGQVIAASILVIPGRFRVNDLHGILGIHLMPASVSIIVSIFAVIVVINSFNLIDGVDGLAGGISLLISLTYGYIFWSQGMHNMLIATAAIAGAIISFLYYNRQPAKIFMGDAGSMCIGYLIAAFSFRFINIGNQASGHLFQHTPAIVVAFLIIPLFDTLRVFIIRVSKKKSPFSADCNHIHHKLLDLGFSHHKVTIILCTTNVLFIILACIMKNIDATYFIFLIVLVACLLTSIPYIISLNDKRKAERLLLEPSLKEITPSNSEKQIATISENSITQKLHLN